MNTLVPQIEGDVTGLIERVAVAERRLGVRFEALFAYHRPGYDVLEVNGELHPRDATAIMGDIAVRVEVYDSSGQLLDRAEHLVVAAHFFGYATFLLHLSAATDQLCKLRLYPWSKAKAVKTRPVDASVAGRFETIVVGTKYHRGHTEGLVTGDQVQLAREPENAHDPNAVQVKLQNGEVLGYIPSEVAAVLAPRLDAGLRAQAQISRVTPKAAYVAVIADEPNAGTEGQTLHNLVRRARDRSWLIASLRNQPPASP